MSGYFAFRKDTKEVKDKKSKSVGLILSLPQPSIEVAGTQLKNQLPKRTTMVRQKNNSAIEFIEHYEKQLRKTLYDNRRDKYIGNIVVLANKQKMAMMDQYNPSSIAEKHASLPGFSPRKTFLSTKTDDFKSIGILNKTIFTNPTRKKKSQEPFELAINKLPILPQKKLKHKNISEQFRQKIKKQPEIEEKPKPQLTFPKREKPLVKPEIRGWDVSEETYF